MITLSKEFKVGIFAILGIASFFWGYNFLKGTEMFNSTRTYYLVFNDVDGLAPASNVILNGYSVGKVRDIKLGKHKDGNYKWVVGVVLSNKIDISDNSLAILEDDGPLGGKVIKLELKSSGKILEPEDTLKTAIEPGMVEKLSAKFDPITQKLDSTLRNVNKMIDSQTQESFKTILKNLEQTTALINTSLASASPALNGSLKNVETLTASLVQTEKKLKPLLSKVDGIADSLNHAKIAATVAEAHKTLAELNQVVTKINKGEGSLGLLIKTDTLHNNLNKTVKDLDKLFVDMQEHPSRYVHFSIFGKKEKAEKK